MTSLARLLHRGMAEGHEVILVSADGQAVTRAEFRALVAAARRALWAHGDPRGRRIALHGAVTPPLLACMVAALVDGAVVVPLDTELPALRKATMIELAQARLVFDFEGGSPDYEPRGAEVVDASDRRWPGDGPADPATLARLVGHDIAGRELDDGGPCYVFFTSGTTGTPKGVLGRRGGLAHFVSWETGMLGVSPGDRVSILTRLSFDVVMRDILTPIIGGATGCIAPRQLAAGAMLDWLDERAITVTHVVPSLARSFLSAARPGFAGRALRHTLFAGEPLTAGLVRRWREVFPGSAIYNLYGPTETTLAKFCARIDGRSESGDEVMPCGYPLPGAEAIILDGRGGAAALAAPGETGEVAIATPHRSLGYLDPGQTRERFVRISDREVYLTGDLGFVAPDGQLHLRGRKDDQVKVRGVRIELAGVGAVIESFPGVGSAAVVCVDDEDDRRLVAYFTASANGAPIAQALRGYLADRLPPAAIPSRFIELPAMPLTPNGKLDRARLPAPDRAEVSGEPAATDDERVVAEAFAAALRRPGVGALDDFFALGGNSLAATGVCAAIQRRLGAYIAPAELLTAATPRALAERVRTARPPAPIRRARVQRHFALTPQQRRYFRTFCAGGNRSWCNMVAVFALPANTSRAAVEQALADIAGRHDSLRLGFSFDDAGAPRQSIDFGWDPAVTAIDLSALAPQAARAELDRLRIVEGERPIAPFARGPLFRAQLIALAGGERKLLWTVHHLISDGTSQGILARELTEALADPAPGRRDERRERDERRADPLAQPSFVDVAAWAADRPGLAAARDHFRAQFALPYRHPYLAARTGGDGDGQRCLSLERALPAAAHAHVRALARAHRTTPYAILLAAVFRVMARRTAASDLTILTPLAGRDHPQIAPLIGDFINLVALRVSRIPALPAAELIDTVKQQIQGAARHQAFQLDELLDALGVAFDPDRHPLSGISLNFMPQSGRMPALAGTAGAPGAATDKGYKLKYDVLFLVRDYEDATAIEIQFRAGLFDAGGALALFDELCVATEALRHD
jgi:mycobactin peptide synthetase MbtE